MNYPLKANDADDNIAINNDKIRIFKHQGLESFQYVH